MPPLVLQPVPGAWKSLLPEFAIDLESDNKSKNTIRNYTRNYTDAVRKLHLWLVNPIAPPDVDDPEDWLDSVPDAPEDYHPRHIRRWLSYRLATTSPGNANNNYRSLQPWFKWLIDEDEITVNPMAKIKAPYVPPQPVPVVSVDLMKRVLAVCQGKDFLSRRDEAIIRLIWDTGVRLSEIAYLDVDDDVDMTLRVIHVTGKGSKRRSCPFSAATGKALGRYLRMRARHLQAENTTRLWLSERRRHPCRTTGSNSCSSGAASKPR
ncbi:integrase [Amycolatopsis sp. WAC 01376]|uniref:site-specific integrase n=1 Tax=Amycolatopsis sp. WAC 01376 TaxID=2203195 RepID=UPI000F77AE7C|nr:tyrosine-type recombinase/integrase [Amycolatopsis sp. WAC 01376]RSM60502.1 integrase [Amycolatopsis sp. WAC 01376]